jgi:hypothetical protein
MTNTPDEPERPSFASSTLRDNIGAPDVFADAVVGAFLTNGNVHMTFVTRRCEYSVEPNVFSDVVIGRLVMPLAAVENMAQFLWDYVQRMKSLGPKDAQPPPPRILQ